MKLKRSINVQGREGYIRYPEIGLSFRWNGYHTVNIFRYQANTKDLGGSGRRSGKGVEIDVMSIGDFAQERATSEDFKRAVDNYMHDLVEQAVEEIQIHG